MGFDRAEGGDGAADADEEELLEPAGFHLGEDAEVGGEAGLDPFAGEDLLDGGGEDGAGLHVVVGLAGDADDALHLAAAEHLAGDAGDDAGPLRAGHGGAALGVHHLVHHAEAHLVVGEVAAAAVHDGLERLDAGHAVAQERARILDVRDVVRVAQAALGAVLLGGVGAAGLDGLRLLAPIRRDRAGARAIARRRDGLDADRPALISGARSPDQMVAAMVVIPRARRSRGRGGACERPQITPPPYPQQIPEISIDHLADSASTRLSPARRRRC